MAKKPEKTIRVGGIQISIWSNETAKGTFQTVTIDRSYKDKDNEWKRTNTFRGADLLLIEIGLRKVAEYLYLKESKESKENAENIDKEEF